MPEIGIPALLLMMVKTVPDVRTQADGKRIADVYSRFWTTAFLDLERRFALVAIAYVRRSPIRKLGDA